MAPLCGQTMLDRSISGLIFQTVSPFSSGMGKSNFLLAKKFVLKGSATIIGDGCDTDFFRDSWVAQGPIVQFINPASACVIPSVTVNTMLTDWSHPA